MLSYLTLSYFSTRTCPLTPVLAFIPTPSPTRHGENTLLLPNGPLMSLLSRCIAGNIKHEDTQTLQPRLAKRASHSKTRLWVWKLISPQKVQHVGLSHCLKEERQKEQEEE
ncbi:hypothetical protein E2C01_043135 [Portunus trituberculatus]|uniref:Uncharacterized protein n=1 Tax=Portunus trituberculatus TaxID=210409 RepID=A0A5B7FVA9_PORTR|nr:hypothetical protein [Portunus trituberculatus]